MRFDWSFCSENDHCPTVILLLFMCVCICMKDVYLFILVSAIFAISSYLACALMVRGKVSMSDIRRNIDRLQPSLHFVHWNQHGWKTGLCSVPPIGQVECSVL